MRKLKFSNVEVAEELMIPRSVVSKAARRCRGNDERKDVWEYLLKKKYKCQYFTNVPYFPLKLKNPTISKYFENVKDPVYS